MILDLIHKMKLSVALSPQGFWKFQKPMKCKKISKTWTEL